MDHLPIQPGQEFYALTNRMRSWNGWLGTLVLNADGGTVGEDGTSKPLSNHLDLQLLLTLRSKSDVIVTTGKTARLENYRASRFAPLVILSRNSQNVSEVPALLDKGTPTLVLSEFPDSSLFNDVERKLRNDGSKSFLFEGGVSSLRNLVSQVGEILLVTSFANLEDPTQIDIRAATQSLFEPEKRPNSHLSGSEDGRTPSLETVHLDLVDDFYSGLNRVALWMVRS